MNTQPEPRYTAERANASQQYWLIDNDKPEDAGLVTLVESKELAELLASLLNRGEQQQREIEWLREQMERVEQMVIALQAMMHGHGSVA